MLSSKGLIILAIPLIGVHSFTQLSISGISLRVPKDRKRSSLSPFRTSSASAALIQVASEPRTESESDVGNLNLHDDRHQNFMEPGINLIPLESPDQPKLEKEFYSMMREFTLFTPKDVASVSDPRYRALYEGVAAGSNEKQVMNAFSIVFQDLMPVRIAGRMIFRHLKSTMEESIEVRDLQEKELADEYGLDMNTINDGRRAYLAVMQDDTSEGEFTMGELIDSGIVDTIVELLGFDTFDDFVQVMDTDANERLTFEKFIVGLQRCQSETSCDVNCNLSEVLVEIIQRMEPLEDKKKDVGVTERKRKYSERYDAMVTSFEEWEELVPTGEDGRMLEVLKGSFTGAKNEKIVKALKIVYMDYSALRVGGDLVFKLMSKIIRRRKKKMKSNK